MMMTVFFLVFVFTICHIGEYPHISYYTIPYAVSVYKYHVFLILLFNKI